jgi:hypothetical protein
MQWLSGINGLAGIWMIISPWVLGFSSEARATWSAVIVGIIVLVLGAIRFFTGFPGRNLAVS